MQQSQIYVSVLLPAFQVTSEEAIPIVLKEQLLIPFQSFDIIEIPSLLKNKEYCIRMKDVDFSLKVIENIITQNRLLNNQLSKCKETISALQSQLKNSSPIDEQEQLKTLKMNKNIKSLKKDNKKLRQMLKSQLNNSEKSRLETQTTIETLREEFDLLVGELASLQKRDPNQEQIKHNLTKLAQKQQSELEEI